MEEITYEKNDSDWVGKIIYTTLAMLVGFSFILGRWSAQRIVVMTTEREVVQKEVPSNDDKSIATDEPENKVYEKHTRDVLVQSQVTYRLDLQYPKFQPLPAESSGAWPQGWRIETWKR